MEKKTVLRLAGDKVAYVLNTRVRNVNSWVVQADETWAFVHTKQHRLRPGDPVEWGDQYVFVVLDAYTKLVLTFAIGKRDVDTTYQSISDLHGRVANRIQLFTDGYKPYIDVVDGVFGIDIDSAQTKKYHTNGVVTGVNRNVIQGHPDPSLISTSYVGRLNATMRGSIRRMTRLTHAFSNSLPHLYAAVAPVP